MAWDFETDPEFQKKLDWIEDLMENEVEPLSHLGMAAVATEGRETLHQAAAGEGEGAGPVGLPSRRPISAARAMARSSSR